jgi:D-alanyl-D-alanine carboxypeptidase/D-alanyl-D-alanine-endopeptidase (penicillin-binding protein 4)
MSFVRRLPVLTVLAAAGVALSSGMTAGLDASTPSGGIPGLGDAAVQVMTSEPYEHSTWAISVADVDSGEMLVDHNSELFLEPASATKTYSVGAAWLKWGPDSRITTPVVHTGRVRRGVLEGDLVLIGKGDLTMGGQTGPDGEVVFTNLDHNDANLLPGATIADNDPLAGLDKLAAQVREAGIRKIRGRVIVDDRLFETKDLGTDDGPVSPIIINNNLIDLVTTPTSEGQAATVAMRPKVAPWRLRNEVTTAAPGTETDVAVSVSDRGTITLSGAIAADSKPLLKVWHVEDPATFARNAFVGALRRAGVRARGAAFGANAIKALSSQQVVDALPQVAALDGLPLEQNARYILKVSYNRGAQTQVCLLAVAAGSRDCAAGFPEMAKVLSTAGVDPRGASLVDGSGLPGNYVTTTSLVQLMRVFAERPDLERWRNALPIMGVDGSIAEVGKDSPARGHVYAKTGTLGAGDLLNGRLRLESKALAGYMDAASGRRLAFAIVQNQAMFDNIEGVFAANDDLGKIAESIYTDY